MTLEMSPWTSDDTDFVRMSFPTHIDNFDIDVTVVEVVRESIKL